jgi:penicillin-binding protein 2
LTNKAIAGQYAPGSTFKTMVSLAALESGIITKDHTVVCGGRMYLGNQTRYCDKVHGALDMKQAIAQSCDIYYYDVARRVGIDTIAAMAKRFGLGGRLDIDLPNEAPGLVPSRAWKRATYGVPWTPGEDLNAGIGQGYLLVTPLQLATQAAQLANGGFAVRPHLARDRIVGHAAESRAEDTFQSIGISQASLQTVVDAMVAVCNSPGGTVFNSRTNITDPAMAMGGKTGTAQVHHLAVSEHHLEGFRKIDSLPWKMRDNALFIGFAPVSAPRFSIAVIVEHGGFGSTAAVPIARDVLIEVQKRYPPKTAMQQGAPCCSGGHDHDHEHG